jgi:outer membrane lipoprotein-sorting protein
MGGIGKQTRLCRGLVMCTALVLILVLNLGLDAQKSGIDDVLDALQQSGKDVKSFTADVKMKIEDEVMGTDSTQSGKVWFQTRPGGDAVVHVSFDEKTVAGKTFKERREFLLDDGWLTERDFARKHETRVQLVPRGQKINLFQLGKGPFPLPIGQDKKDVHDQFDVKKIDADKDDPANTIHLQLTPKPGTPLAENFATIDVWVDCNTRMPARMATDNRKHTEYRTTDLSGLQVNPAINPGDVALPELDKGWTTDSLPLK